MKLTGLEVDGFGVWSQLALDDLSDQLNVVYGPNEAGKTTLMQFVRSVFFGFSPLRRGRYFPPLHAGTPGGSIRAIVGDAECTIARHADETGEADQLTIARGTRHVVDSQQALTGLLGDVDEATFNNVFVFGLREIQELATLSDTQAAEELYNLALGLDRVSLIDVLRELNASRERLLSADDRPSLVAQLLSQRERLETEIDELSGASARYLSLAAQRKTLDGQVAALEAETAQWDDSARGLALGRGLSDRWRRRAALHDELAQLSGVGTMPDGALPRFESLSAKMSILRRRLRGLKRTRQELRRQITALEINEGLCRHAPRLEALAEQQHWIAALEKQLAAYESEIAAIQQRADETKQQCGAATTAAPLSKRALAELRGAAAALRAARGELHNVESGASPAEQSADALARRIGESLGAAKDKGLTAALAEAGQLVSELRRRVQLDERIGQMSTRQTELEAQSHEHLDAQLLPTWALAGLGGLFVLGCALVLLFLAGLVLPESLGDSLSWPVGVVGVAAAAAAGLTKFGMERGAEKRLDRCHEQISRLSDQVEQAKAERDALDARLPRGGGPLVARLQAAEKSLARLEDLVPLEAQRDSAQREIDSARQQAEAVRGRAVDARKRWRRLLAENGLPADLHPKQLKSLVAGRRAWTGLEATLADKRAELGRRRVEYEALSMRITQLVAQTGVVPRSQRPLEQLQQCLAELGAQQSLVKERDELTRQIAVLRRRYVKASRRRNRLSRRRVVLMRAAGTLDELEFRRRAALATDAARLKSEHAQLDREITGALAAASDAGQVAAWLADGANLAQLEAQVAEKRRVAAARLAELNQRRGELHHQLKLMLEDRRLTDKRMELDVVEQRLGEAVERWRVLATCGLLLEAVRQYYEREHQPQALREASGHLKRLTGGRYTRVWTPLGQQVLRVDDAEGHTLPLEVLSSGTREQLFLALRLALASAYARRGVELPLVLDDVLVNFDVARAKAAALVLRDFARAGHQVLIFTCHEHIARLFRHVKAEVRTLPDHAQGGAVIVEKPAATRSRADREEEPPPIAAAEPPRADMGLEAELIVEAAEPAGPIEKPKPQVLLPAPAPPQRAPVRTERVRWSAEEFEGELSDRVRRDAWQDEATATDDAHAGDDTQAA